MMPHHFNSSIKALSPFAYFITNDSIKNEPMFFNSDIDYAYENGGPITKSFILHLPEDVKNSACVFDSRCHMLMPGWWPAIPGYHHDDVPRPDIPAGKHFMTAGQPDYITPRYRSKHIMGLVNAGVAPTHFALGQCEMPDVPDGELIYRKWHPEVERLLKSGSLKLYEAPDRTLIQFDCDTFHTCSPALQSGWRWFGRVSWDTDRVKKITNEIRVNAQVYLEFPMEGW